MAAENKAAFQALLTQKDDIERDFGAELDWEELPDADGCRIRYIVPGGYQSPVEQWPEIHRNLVDRMIRLDAALRPRVANLQL